MTSTRHSPRMALCVSLAGVLVALSGVTQAMAVAGPGGSAEQGRRIVVATPAPGATPATLDLVSTRIDAVDLAGATITVRGQKVPLDVQQLRVLGARGQAVGPSGLRAGQAVRLAFDPQPPPVAAAASTPAPPRRIVLIYIDG